MKFRKLSDVMGAKQLFSLVGLAGLLVGCGTVSNYSALIEDGTPKPADHPIYVYPVELRVPRPAEVVGEMDVGESLFTVYGGSLEDELKTLQKKARQVGADAVKLTSVEEPDFMHSKHRVEAKLIRFTEKWENFPMTEANLKLYLQADRDFDPLEGIWVTQDTSTNRVGIVKDTKKPGRTLIAFILNSTNPTWQPGDKKMDLANDNRPGVYRGSYYLDDYRQHSVAFRMRADSTNTFMIQLSQDTVPLFFVRE